MEGNRNDDKLQRVISRFGPLKQVDISQYGTKSSFGENAVPNTAPTQVTQGTDIFHRVLAEQLSGVEDHELDAALGGLSDTEPRDEFLGFTGREVEEITDALVANGVVEEVPPPEDVHADIDARLNDAFPAANEDEPVVVPPVYRLTRQGEVVEETKLTS